MRVRASRDAAAARAALQLVTRTPTPRLGGGAGYTTWDARCRFGEKEVAEYHPSPQPHILTLALTVTRTLTLTLALALTHTLTLTLLLTRWWRR